MAFCRRLDERSEPAALEHLENALAASALDVVEASIAMCEGRYQEAAPSRTRHSYVIFKAGAKRIPSAR